jgi:hypothetical protein
MTRAIPLAAVAAAFVLAACGNGATAANSSASPSPDRGGNAFRNGASGQLVQINGQTLILTSSAGDTTVTYSSATAITKTSAGTLADVLPGVCIVATGQKDAAGTLTVTTVRVAPKTTAGCNVPARTFPSPSPGASPRPGPSLPPNFGSVSGEVTAATGISITVLTAAGSVTITVPTTASVTRTYPSSPADLQTGECLRASGQKDSTGTVQATSISITPPGSSGTCSRGGGFPGGGFPGGGFPGGSNPPAAG